MELTELESRITRKRIGRPNVPAATRFQGQRYGAGIELPDLPAELAQRGRHGQMHDACMVRYVGFDLAHDPEFLGHKLIQHTVRYTGHAPTRLKNLFRVSLQRRRAEFGSPVRLCRGLCIAWRVRSRRRPALGLRQIDFGEDFAALY